MPAVPAKNDIFLQQNIYGIHYQRRTKSADLLHYQTMYSKGFLRPGSNVC